MNVALGIDVGATGIKGALVNIKTGNLTTERYKLQTPKSKKPKDIIAVIKQIVEHFDWKGKRLGIGIPSVIINDKTVTASNIDKSWKDFPIQQELEKALASSLVVLNDADAAGLAEIYYRDDNASGTQILLTLGTGIGSAVFLNGKLLKNTELGQIMFKNNIAEKLVSNSARIKLDLSWDNYGKELGEYLTYIYSLFYPELIILGGGISKKFAKFSKNFAPHLNVKPASKFNNTGIIGAALATKLLK